MKSTKNLILYKNFENGKLFYNMAWIMENYENEYYNREDIEALLYECFNQLSELAVSHGFKGNLWHNFIAFILVNNENAYSCDDLIQVIRQFNEDADPQSFKALTEASDLESAKERIFADS